MNWRAAQSRRTARNHGTESVYYFPDAILPLVRSLQRETAPQPSKAERRKEAEAAVAAWEMAD